MAHHVESMFSVRETPWHGLGTLLSAPPTSADAIRAAGLDWTVSLQPLMLASGNVVTHRAAVRDSDGSVLGVVGPKYTPLQNAEAFAWFDPILEAGEATLETAGSLREGARVWVLAQLSREPSVIVKRSDDVVRKYVLLSNAHDGTQAVRVGYTPIRVVCANTLAMAHEDSAGAIVRIRHHKNIADTLAAVRDVMNLADRRFEATAEAYRALASTSIVEADLKKYVHQVFSTPGAANRSKLARTFGVDLEVEEPKSRVLTAVQRLFETGKGNNRPGVRGTYWAAYNAITEYVSYERGSDREGRLDAAWFGGGAALNRTALKVGLALADA
jgi:phage/plasmid-like protein (TIGR03299 family)